MDNSEAMDIACALIQRTGDAIMRRDAETFAQYFAIPQTVETYGNRKVFETREALKTAFFNIVDNQRKRGIDRMPRRCVEASFKSEELVEYIYESRFFVGDQELDEGRTSYAMAQKINGEWLVVYTMYGVSSLSDQFPAISEG